MKIEMKWIQGLYYGLILCEDEAIHLNIICLFKGLRPLPPAPLLTGIRLFGREVNRVDPDKDSIS